MALREAVVVQPAGVDPDKPYTNSETHDTSPPAAHNRVSEITRFLSIVQYVHTSALLPVQPVASFNFNSKTIPLITPLQYVLHRWLTPKGCPAGMYCPYFKHGIPEL